MADETKISTEAGTDSKKIDVTQKRKRVKRIKTVIIATIIILFLVPTILCIILGIRLSKLQRQVDNLLSTYSINTEEKGRKGINGNLAYASTDKLVVKDDMDNSEDDNAIADTDTDAAITDDADNTKDDIDSEDDIDSVDDAAGDTESDSDDNTVDENTDNKENIGEADSTGEPDNSDLQENTDIQDTPPINGDEASDDGVDKVSNNKANTADTVNRNTTGSTSGYYRNPDGKYYDKKVYLTFDDGPTKHTDKILDLLAEYNVKATFFVVGRTDETSKERYRRIVDEGHVLAMHSYSHKYSYIYQSLENFDKDFTKLWNLLYDTTGYKPTLFRFPGGSLGFLSKSKMKQYVNYLNEKGMTYYDWNVVNGDAEGIDYTEKQMINNVLNGVAKKKTSIVLMHDGEGKEKTVATLPKILDALISEGAELLPLDETAPLIQQIKASSLK